MRFLTRGRRGNFWGWFSVSDLVAMRGQCSGRDSLGRKVNLKYLKFEHTAGHLSKGAVCTGLGAQKKKVCRLEMWI